MKKNLYVYGGIALAWVAYLVITLITPSQPSPLTAELSDFQLILLRLSIVAPYLFIWLTGCYGGLALDTYAQSVRDPEEQHALKQIVWGTFILIGGLITTTLISSLRQIFQASYHELVPAMVILLNYAYILFPLVALGLYFFGAKQMARGVHAEKLSFLHMALPTLAAAGVVLVYTWLIFTNANRQVSVNEFTPATYFLSDALIVVSIVIPFFVSLIFGFFSLAYFARYMNNVTGAVYRGAATRFITGIFFVILAGIILQILLSLGSSRLLGLGLALILLIIYVFMAVQAGGYVFIALGAKKLTAVEQLLGKYRFAETEETQHDAH